MLIITLFLFLFFFTTSVLFSGAEISVGSISRDSMERFAENRVRGASSIVSLISNRRRFAIMLLSGRIISIAGGTAALTGLIYCMHLFSGKMFVFNGIIAAIISALIFIFSETLFSKIVSSGEYENRVTRFSFFLTAANIILLPITLPLEFLLSFIKTKNELAEKEEDFIELMKSESESGVIEEDEKEMIESIFEFSETTVKEVMIPRIDVVAVDKTVTSEELIEIFEMNGHSRIPVYDERIDNILGLIYAKDLLIYLSHNKNEKFDYTKVMREPYFVPESKKTTELLKEFKRMKIHLGIVVDEYGGTAGIVTLEDLIEEIIGEINDEYDEEKKDFIWLNDNTVVVDAGLSIGDVNEIIRADIPSEDFDTLGGFIYQSLGFIPEGGEEITRGHLTFKIKEIKGNRISKILVTINESGSDYKKEQKGEY